MGLAEDSEDVVTPVKQPVESTEIKEGKSEEITEEKKSDEVKA